jgi:hypothetical protein
MFNKNMIKETIQKIVAVGASLLMLFAGISFTPMLAQAKDVNNVHGEFHSATESTLQKDEQGEHISDSLNIQDNMFVSGVATAQTTLQQSIKNAKVTFKDAKKAAHVKLVATVTSTTNPTDHTAAIKAYVTDVLGAFKVESAAIEAAFQAFITTLK